MLPITSVADDDIIELAPGYEDQLHFPAVNLAALNSVIVGFHLNTSYYEIEPIATYLNYPTEPLNVQNLL